MQEYRKSELRRTLFSVLLIVSLGWGVFAWAVAPDYLPNVAPSVTAHQWASLGMLGLLGFGSLYEFKLRDQLRDQLSAVTGGVFYEQDGLCFMPLVRVREGDGEKRRAEICLYYQNRFSGPCETVVHLRPTVAGAFYSHRGARDLHFAFRCPPGGFGVIHQPVAVPESHQGESVPVQLAAAVRWPNTHRKQLRSKKGQPVGWFAVDWQLAYRQSKHELGGEIELHEPATIHLTMPERVVTDVKRAEYFNEPLEVPELDRVG